MISLTERYRPQSYDEVVGQNEIIESLKNEREDSRTHKLFIGPAGTGKTTVAHIYAKEIGFPIVEMNAGDERKIGDVRGKIKSFASFVTNRVIFLDEGDSLTGDAQSALRRIMEKTKNSIFIISGNYPHKIIEPIKSRCSVYDFKKLDDDVILLQIIKICKSEGIELPKTKGHEKECDCKECQAKRGFFEIIRQSHGDLRKAINTLETIVGKGKKITMKSVMAYQRPNIALDILNLAYNGNFTEALSKLEDAFINSKLDPVPVIEDTYSAIMEIIPDDNHKSLLLRELAITARACRNENSPLIQLAGFVSFTWLVPHLNSKCPLLNTGGN